MYIEHNSKAADMYIELESVNVFFLEYFDLFVRLRRVQNHVKHLRSSFLLKAVTCFHKKLSLRQGSVYVSETDNRRRN